MSGKRRKRKKKPNKTVETSQPFADERIEDWRVLELTVDSTSTEASMMRMSRIVPTLSTILSLLTAPSRTSNGRDYIDDFFDVEEALRGGIENAKFSMISDAKVKQNFLPSLLKEGRMGDRLSSRATYRLVLVFFLDASVRKASP